MCYALIPAGAYRRGTASRGDFEDGAVAVGPAIRSCSVEVPIGGLDQPGFGEFAVRAVEAENAGESLRVCGQGRHGREHADGAGSPPPLRLGTPFPASHP
jgi:hypothetical protein